MMTNGPRAFRITGVQLERAMPKAKISDIVRATGTPPDVG